MSRASRIGVCTDSSAHLPDELVDRHDVAVVPVTLVVDGREHLDGPHPAGRRTAGPHLDGPHLDGPGFAGVGFDGPGFDGPGFDRSVTEVVVPSPGQYALAFEQLLDLGATEILSIHGHLRRARGGDAESSATSRAARLAAHRLDVPVRVVDTRRHGFGVGACTWVGAVAAASGATLDEVVAVVERCVATATAFLVPSVLVASLGDGPHPGAYPVLRCDPGEAGSPQHDLAAPLRRCDTVLDAVNAIAREVLAFGDGLRIGIGHGHPDAAVVADALASALGESASSAEVVRHRLTGWADELPAGALTCTVVPGDPG